MKRVGVALSVLLWAAGLSAQGFEVRVQTETNLPLSIAQEADEAIERGQRWLTAQTFPTNALPARILVDYALASAEKPFTIRRCDLTPLEQAMPPETDVEACTNLTATLALPAYHHSPKALFALQRDLPKYAPPPDWREQVALVLINTPRIAPTGGHWQTPEETLWALLALRALLNESAPIRVE